MVEILLHFVINVAISDAFIIFKESGRSRKKRYGQLDSRLALAEELIGNFSGRKKPKPTHKLQSLTNHIFVRLGRSRSYCKRCFVSAPRKRKDTCYGCAVCNVYLCSNACYNKYHRIHQLQEEWENCCCRMWTGFIHFQLFINTLDAGFFFFWISSRKLDLSVINCWNHKNKNDSTRIIALEPIDNISFRKCDKKCDNVT